MKRGVLVLLCAVALLALAGATPVSALFLGEWGGTGSGDGQFENPTSVATDNLNNVYVADSGNNRIQKFTELGAFVAKWGSAGSGPGQFSTPVGVATDVDGNVYVVDKGNFRIEKFSPNGDFLAQWGSHGGGSGQFEAPTAIAVDPTGNVFVADAGANRIDKFDPTGKAVGSWGSTGTSPGQFNAPGGVATDPVTGDVYVADSGNHRIQKFTGTGEFLLEWGSSGEGPGQFGLPAGVATDPVGKVYVADATNNRIQKFSPTGEFLSTWGESGEKPNHFLNPLAVAASFSGKVYVADAGNNRIEGFGKIPAPAFAKTVNVVPVGGTVRIQPPHGHRFRRLLSLTQIKVGSTIDTTSGKVQLTSAKDRLGTTQTADFFDGRFKVLQPRKGKPITQIKLEGKLDCGKPAKGSATASRSRSRKVWGSGHGNFRSEGQHGSATVRGTIWLTQDRCDGTLFRVRRGVVTIEDFTLHRKLKLHPGQQYLAAAP
jgi:DNA-binding beta-propeller fold protein YncE